MTGISDRTSNIANRVSMEDRLLAFGANLVDLAEELRKTIQGRVILGQLLRSGTSIGANYEEATAAESKADFIHKMQISLKEARETCYWLRLLEKTKFASIKQLDHYIDEALQIRAILTKSVITAKSNQLKS